MIARTSGFREDDVEVALELIDDNLARGPQSEYRFLVAADEDLVLGYVCYGLIPLTESSHDLYWIVVDPEHQRRGIGAKLMAAMREAILSMGGKRVYIDTSSTDLYAPARKFYESQGYTVTARFPDFYRDGDAKVVYWRGL